MRKSVCLVVVLLTLVAIGNAQGTVIKKGKLKNQTAPIPETVIVTPTTDGLFRLSLYASVTTIDISSKAYWYVNVFWTDDFGSQAAANILWGLPQWGGQFINPAGGATIGGVESVFEAKAGTPISYSVTQTSGSDSSAYSLYYTLERLE